MAKKSFRSKIGGLYISFGVLFLLLAGVLLIYPQLPHILNTLSINTPEKEEENITQPIYAQEEEPVVEEPEEPVLTLPDSDPTLPEQNYIIIPKIGVDAVIQEGEDSEAALENGPWIVPDYATPESRYLEETPRSVIIASHRFGYSSWSEQKRREISFFNLPETKIGDRIIVIWNQREYVYEIVEVGETTYVEEYDTDLILYTCRYFNSPVRIFRYANLVLINDEVPETL
jgi:sortase (surface protein transpeptidase)